MIKCDRCIGMDAPFCVESCPTHALLFLDSEEIARGTVKLRKDRLIGLNFVSASGLGRH
jgi:Fe-S-cluster-containing hydrogenase component 2